MGVSPIAVPQGLAYVLNSAGDKSNVDFDYLLQTAIRESSLNPEAKAPTSSAVGLFQFVESTWLQVMKEQGPRLGYQQYADAISVDGDGDYVIRNKAMRREVLALREDPQIAADMAAAFTQSNGAYLEGKFGKHPSPGELYIAHFLGPQGAERLLRAGLDNPDQIAAKLFPKQARANKQIFYSGGEARTIKELYRALVAKHVGTPATVTVDDPKFATQQLAQSADSRWATDAVPSRFSKDDMSFTSFFSTEPPRPVAEPLIATDALQSLVAPEVGAPLMSYAATQEAVGPPAPDLGFVPLPAPAPLAPQQQVAAQRDPPPRAYNMPVAAGVTDLMDSSIPRPRVLMSNQPSALFVTQLYSKD
ncbi:MAG: transglycosylase SLT domain-containing protein [Devosia sp.]